MGGVGQAREQRLGVRMRRRAENALNRRGFDDAPRIHDGDAIDQLRDDAEIVGDEQDREAERIAKLAEQTQDLRLHRHVERGRRLVRDQDLRLAGQRDRDHDPLAHSAGKLVRIGAELHRRVRDADHFEKLAGLERLPGASRLLMNRDGFLNLFADLHHRVERRHRLLENHRNAATAGFDALVRL